MKDKRAGIAEVYSGLGSMVLFGALFAFTDLRIFILVGVFAGVLPMIRGLSKIQQARLTRKEQQQIEEQTAESNERVVLRLAQSQGGQLTPAVVAVNSGLTLDEAESELGTLVNKGHAQLDVADDGRLIYTFPEFLA